MTSFLALSKNGSGNQRNTKKVHPERVPPDKLGRDSVSLDEGKAHPRRYVLCLLV